uniref:melanoma-associated antigen 10-like n=1 Tax=Jaculus jaculus TaxID=51337 RepID=UPI0003331BE2|nr:melanoma-associated antigen 10-like [Jaculus jaculus]
MSHHYEKRPRVSLEQDVQDPTERQDLTFTQAPLAEEKEKEGEKASNDEKTTSSTYASLNVAPFSGPHPSSLSLPYSLAQGDAQGAGPSTGMLRNSRGLQRSYSSISWSRLHEESGRQKGKKRVGTVQPIIDTESLWKKRQTKMVNKLVKVLVLKYRKKTSITQVEMLKVVTKSWQKQFPLIFKKAVQCLEVIYGIDVKKNDQMSSCYILVNSLNLTYGDTMMPGQRLPRNGFLILILGLIFIDGNSASEESVWKFLNTVGVYEGIMHSIYGEPKGFLTRELVQEKYLEYQQVPNSETPRFNFLWGPRAHAETNKMKVLEHLAKFTGRDPAYYSFMYAEAFREDEERAWARAFLLNSASAILIADHLLTTSAMQKEEPVSSAVEEDSEDSQ